VFSGRRVPSSREQFFQRAGLDDGTGEDVGADFGALFDDAHRQLGAGFLGELLEADRGAEARGAGADDHHVVFHRFTRHSAVSGCYLVGRRRTRETVAEARSEPYMRTVLQCDRRQFIRFRTALLRGPAPTRRRHDGIPVAVGFGDHVLGEVGGGADLGLVEIAVGGIQAAAATAAERAISQPPTTMPVSLRKGTEPAAAACGLAS
jgi:hypothetical protein